MESQVKIKLPCSLGEKLYKLKDYKIVEYTVEKLEVETKVTDVGISSKVKIYIYGGEGMRITFSIDESELNTKYFFDKKDITKLIVDQL